MYNFKKIRMGKLYVKNIGKGDYNVKNMATGQIVI